jgi:hypothetical protein
MKFEIDFTDVEDTHAWDAEDEKHYWSGTGFVEFLVLQNDDDNFEIEEIDYDGCVNGMNESIGLEYQIQHIWCIQEDFKEGYVYTLHDVTVTWIRGEWGISDDDVEYDFAKMTCKRLPLIQYLKLKISNIWWRSYGWKLKR